MPQFSFPFPGCTSAPYGVNGWGRVLRIASDYRSLHEYAFDYSMALVAEELGRALGEPGGLPDAWTVGQVEEFARAGMLNFAEHGPRPKIGKGERVPT